MDNISRSHSNEDTTVSMYLSFDAESTMSTACYKTMEAMSDMNDSVDQNSTEDQNTLELNNNSENISPLRTVKKMEIADEKITPFRVLPKNILMEYKVMCSTPSKEQLLKTVDVTRGSDATRCADLGLAFLGIDDEKPPYFPPPAVRMHEENKENVVPDAEEVSTLSTCSSVEITSSVIEKKMSSIATVGSITEEESVENVKIIEDDQKDKVAIDMVEDITENYSILANANNANQTVKEPNNVIKVSKVSPDITPKTANEGAKTMGITEEFLEIQEEKKSVGIELEADRKITNRKSYISVLTGNVRRSMCEPNLQTNKPSRIFNSDTKGRSLLPTCRKSTISMDAEIEIPLLMRKMLKITNTSKETEQSDTQKVKEKIDKPGNSTTAEKRRSVMSSMKTRTSLIPSCAGSKRPFSFNQRMSVVVKTTLNSPARKIARKSAISGITSSIQRRSIIPPKNATTADNMNIQKTGILPRKSMVPKTSQPSHKTLEKFARPINNTDQRKSLYSLENISEKGAVNTNACVSHNKPSISYTCSVCKEKFRIKSLLDAHKRSHESDNSPPAFIKKTLPTTRPANGTTLGNQCKYCDKKFALLKALHIHLLQNCSKIPPSEKRKLQYTDLNHVEKAQLPNVFPYHNLQTSSSSSVSSANVTPRYQSNLNIAKSSSESLNENKDTQNTSNIIRTASGSNLTSSHAATQKSKKISAHAGVYRTPSKFVPCHLCKLTFKSILDYTNHNLTAHSSYKAIVADEAVKAGKKDHFK